MKAKTFIIVIVSIIIVCLVVAFFVTRNYSDDKLSSKANIKALYLCDANKTIATTYHKGQSMPAVSPDEPPVPGGSVDVVLSDGRTMTLKQTISADGGRYANTDESIVLWNKGNGVTFTENNVQTYAGCIKVADDPGGLSQVYKDSAGGFSLRYPSGFVVNNTYKYQELGPGKEIAGVKFTIPVTISEGTNLSSDSYLSVEEIPQAKNCTATLFLDQGAIATEVSDGNTTYSVASSTGAGAGNRYEETVYSIPGTNPCVAVRYFVHYGVMENYPIGKVREFDSKSLISQFDSIRRTLIVK